MTAFKSPWDTTIVEMPKVFDGKTGQNSFETAMVIDRMTAPRLASARVRDFLSCVLNENHPIVNGTSNENPTTPMRFI